MERNRGVKSNGRWPSARPSDRGKGLNGTRPTIFELARQQYEARAEERTLDPSMAATQNSKSRTQRSPFYNDARNKTHSGENASKSNIRRHAEGSADIKRNQDGKSIIPWLSARPKDCGIRSHINKIIPDSHGFRYNNRARNEGKDFQGENIPDGHGFRSNIRASNKGKDFQGRTIPNGHVSTSNDRPRNAGKYPQGRNFSRPETKRLYPMGYKQLESLLTKPAGQVLFSIKSRSSGFKELLNYDGINNNEIDMCLHAMAIACDTGHTESLTEFLKILLEDCHQFLNMRLERYLIDIQNDHYKFNELNSLGYILDFIERLQSTVAQESLLTTQLLIPQIAATITRLHSLAGEGSELVKRVEKIDETKTQLLNRYTIIHGATRKDEDKVPNNFRDIPIFPDKHDLLTNQRPFLRPNVVEGRYKSADHYLDVQFRLLREDFVRPLREGIAVYLDQMKNNRRERLQDIKVYQDVTLNRVNISDDGISHEIRFNVEQLGNVQWDRSKRLIYGALVCLTFDNFETVYFGTVCERIISQLRQGITTVKFEKQDEILHCHSKTFTMVETVAYFEASRHNLSALQSTDENNFPMKEYIVELQKEISKPRYLTNDSVYCLRPITKESSKRNSLNSLCSSTKANCSCASWHFPGQKPPLRAQNVCLFRNDTWPIPDELNLDPSQFDALKSALTQKLTIIQGPPGTGKTHVGLKIMEVLLHNQSSWNTEIDNEEKNPILVVCYTNHALDQFLEGVLKLTDKIIRMGGRSKSDKLIPFQMNNLKRIMVQSRTGENYVEKHFHDVKSEIEKLLTDIKTKERTLKTCELEICSENDLRNEISDALYNSFYIDAPKFYKLSNRDNGKVLSYWLGVNVPAHFADGEPSGVPQMTKTDRNQRGELDLKFSCPNEIMKTPKKGANRNPQANVAAAPTNLEVAQDDQAQADVDSIMDQRVEDTEEHEDVRVVHLNRPESNDEIIPQNDASEWKTQGGKKQERKNLKSQLGNITVLSYAKFRRIRNIWNLKMEDRWRLYKTWLTRFIRNETQRIDELKKKYETKLTTLKEMKIEEEIIVAKSALVIGMTTTGAAKYQHLVRNIKSKIVVVEEAAEVLEAHIVTSLSKYTEHVILIGDHQQLRPNPTVYELARRYNLEISLFERLIKNGVPFVRLGIQHRMKPSISRLLVPHIYDKLEDHPSVYEYKEILGFEKSVFFVSHRHFELKDNDSTTRVNTHEAEFLVALCRYILQQGYLPSQITILTTYLGQLFTLKRLMTGPLEKVRTSVVDNYQGEENDIILLSFVRSNEQGVIGFLKTDNRVCVALSRAKKGLFCIGNFDSFSRGSLLWANITQELSHTNAIGPALNLSCEVHGNVVAVSSAFDFTTVPDGGCTLPCDYRLLCGHVCHKMCHPLDREHKTFQCQKPCVRMKRNCNNQHQLKCRNRCHEVCELCTVMVLKTIPKCKHEINLQCHVDEKKYKCTLPCPKILPCGHGCAITCGEDCNEPCKVMVLKTLPKCMHKIYLQCHVDEKKYKCILPCPKILACGHRCAVTCGEVCKPCKVMVLKTIPKCNHQINLPCHVDEKEYKCTLPCPKILACGHRCAISCGVDCKPCKVLVLKTIPKCNHEINLPCHVDEKKYKCTLPCPKILPCGHRCTNTCENVCGDCHVMVNKRVPCGHEIRIECSYSVDEIQLKRACKEKCLLILDCGHHCRNTCGKPCQIRCNENVRVTLPCGHRISSTCEKSKNKNQLLETCQVKCVTNLECGHKCSGTCGKCYQGRLHIFCDRNCQKTLVCGHTCKSHSCSTSCPPCTRRFDSKCPHGRWNETCGSPRPPCQEKCKWNCMHFKCTANCGEPCNRPPCNKYCQRKLRCGHKCVGMCGEPCPSLCRICDRNELRKDHPQARYVQLQDCEHALEIQWLTKWIQSIADGGVIKALACPICKTPIHENLRFGNQLKTTLAKIDKVKVEISRKIYENGELRKNLKSKVENFSKEIDCQLFAFSRPSTGKYLTRLQSVETHSHRYKMYADLFLRKLINLKPVSDSHILSSIDNMLNILNILLKVQVGFKANCVEINEQALAQFETDIEAYGKTFVENIYQRIKNSVRVSAQFTTDLRLETMRWQNMANILKDFGKTRVHGSQTFKDLFDSVMTELLRCKPFTDKDLQALDSKKKELMKLSDGAVMGISQEEKVNIVNAIGFERGHWYTCPNDHVYYLDKRGGAVLDTSCNECGVPIGAPQQALSSGNKVSKDTQKRTRRHHNRVAAARQVVRTGK